jgi:hypothetical protein
MMPPAIEPSVNPPSNPMTKPTAISASETATGNFESGTG